MIAPPFAGRAFDSIAERYDAEFTESDIGRRQRRAVLRIADQVFQPGERILELNCGTGVDAVHLASRGVSVFATDASSEMISIARRRTQGVANVRFDVCAIEDLAYVRGPFDGVFSNFSGLNCISDLDSLAEQLARLIRPGGTALLCVFGSFCMWESAWCVSRLELGKAFRRIRGTSRARVGSMSVDVRYWRIRELRRAFMPWLDLKRWHGIGILVPPSYMQDAAKRWPRSLRIAAAADEKLGSLPVVRGLADHTVLEFRRTNVKG